MENAKIAIAILKELCQMSVITWMDSATARKESLEGAATNVNFQGICWWTTSVNVSWKFNLFWNF
jgi:hypothetical protein